MQEKTLQTFELENQRIITTTKTSKMLEEIKELNQMRTDIMWLIELRSVDFPEKIVMEKAQIPGSLKRIAIKYYSLSDGELLDSLAFIGCKMDRMTASISLTDLSGII